MRRVCPVAVTVMVMATSFPSIGAAEELYWYYQYAGIVSPSSSLPTAVAMGDEKAWPVVFVSTTSSSIQPVTLGPFRNADGRNPGFNTYWHPLGQPSFFQGSIMPTSLLTARNTASGDIGVFVDLSPTSMSDMTTAFVGRRQTGLTASATNVLGLIERPDGALEALPTSAFPIASQGPVRSIATTPWGGLGVVTTTNSVNYHESASLLGWQSAPALFNIGFNGHADLAYDGGGRPVIAHYSPLAGASVSATHFDTRSGNWLTNTLGIGAGTLPIYPTAAGDSKGGVGVAWVGNNGTANTLMYAYKPLGADWKTHTVVQPTGFSVPTSIGGPLVSDSVSAQARVGLAFDADDLPVISFTGTSRKVYIAYDPIFPTGSVKDESRVVAVGETMLDDSFVTGPIRFVKEGGGTLIRDGAATNAYGTLVTEGTLVIRNPTAIAAGPFEIAAAGAVVVDRAIDPKVPALAVERLEVEAGGRLDLGHGRITVAADGISEQDLRAALAAGRSGGGWNGTGGIVSSEAASVPAGTRGVGYAVVEDGIITVAFAAPGDTNLDGLVNVFDLVEVSTAGRYGDASPAGWSDGDFNYDGVANVFDLLAVSSAEVFGAGDYLADAPAALETTAGVVAVPEPRIRLTVFAFIASALLARRPRRRRDG